MNAKKVIQTVRAMEFQKRAGTLGLPHSVVGRRVGLVIVIIIVIIIKNNNNKALI